MKKMNKMVPHTVTEEEMIDFMKDHWVSLAGSFGDRSHKSLETSLEGKYRVLNQKELVHEGYNRTKAIAVYNQLP